MCRMNVQADGEIDPKKATAETAEKIREEIRKFSPKADVTINFKNKGAEQK